MRITLTILMAGLMAGIAVPAFAELQNVEVGGSIRIRGNAYLFSEDSTPGNAIVDSKFFEQRTTVNVSADFTDDVSAFIELDSYNEWGDNFRGATDDGSSHGGSQLQFAQGQDRYSATNVGLYQAYIEMQDAWGYPINVRIGRQEVQFGSEWLIGNNDTSSLFRGLSFDAIRADYVGDVITVTALYAKLAENNGGFPENDGDVDLYVVYGSYTGQEDMVVDAYYMYMREGEHFGAVPIPDSAEIHTVGARVAGNVSNFDYEVEGAYQFGDWTDAVGTYNDLEYQAFAGNVEVGYTFDTEYSPRVFIGGAYFSGTETQSDGSAELAFNRLFSDWEYSEFLENTALSNVIVIRGGAAAQVTEQVGVSVVASYFQAVEDFTDTTGTPLSPQDDELGWEIGLYLTYDYSEDLYFEFGYAHFFTEEEGMMNFVTANGLDYLSTNDDMDYLYWETGIRF